MTLTTSNAHAAYVAFIKADEEWSRELRLLSIENYLPAGMGEQGSHLRALYDARQTAREALLVAYGLD